MSRRGPMGHDARPDWQAWLIREEEAHNRDQLMRAIVSEVAAKEPVYDDRAGKACVYCEYVPGDLSPRPRMNGHEFTCPFVRARFLMIREKASR